MVDAFMAAHLQFALTFQTTGMLTVVVDGKFNSIPGVNDKTPCSALPSTISTPLPVS
ncbi:hypothetical protein D3C87_2035850 [compost metagenome]